MTLFKLTILGVFETNISFLLAEMFEFHLVECFVAERTDYYVFMIGVCNIRIGFSYKKKI